MGSLVNAASIYLSCHEGLELDFIKTRLALKDLEITNDKQIAQLDLCFKQTQTSEAISAPHFRAGASHQHGWDYNDFSYDPFRGSYNYSTEIYQVNYLELYIKDKQEHPIWLERKRINNIKNINNSAKDLINNIPIAIILGLSEQSNNSETLD